jgi:hypothetical protein
MTRRFRIAQIVKRSESPFILTLNNNNHLIGDRARALEGYMQEGMNVSVSGYFRDADFLIENIDFLDGVKKGVQVDTII